MTFSDLTGASLLAIIQFYGVKVELTFPLLDSLAELVETATWRFCVLAQYLFPLSCKLREIICPVYLVYH